ncbi:hypothetical protein V2E29_26385 [Streptomyces diastatochromogenes]|uniref:hypothetical protein n=1 Tax=Streptomyces diastatochromogenes TaxID=42236 RepID=UPI002F260927
MSAPTAPRPKVAGPPRTLPPVTAADAAKARKSIAKLDDVLAMVTRALLTLGGGALVFTCVNVTRFGVSHEIPWYIAWMLDPLASLALITVLYVDGVLAEHGGDYKPGGWPFLLRWTAGLSTWVMNCWTSLYPDGHFHFIPQRPDAGGILLHSVAPALLILLAEAATGYRKYATRRRGQLTAIIERFETTQASERDAAQKRAREEAEREEQRERDREEREEQRERDREERAREEAEREAQRERDREEREAARREREENARLENERRQAEIEATAQARREEIEAERARVALAERTAQIEAARRKSEAEVESQQRRTQWELEQAERDREAKRQAEITTAEAQAEALRKEAEAARRKTEAEVESQQRRTQWELEQAERDREAERQAGITTAEAQAEALRKEAEAAAEAERIKAEAEARILEEAERAKRQRALERAAARTRSTSEDASENGAALTAVPALTASESEQRVPREVRAKQRDEAERYIAKCELSGLAPDLDGLAKHYGKGETWVGDRVRGAKRRLAEEPGFEESVIADALDGFTDDGNDAAGAA